MSKQLKAIAFDLDAASLLSLRQACPEWTIEVIEGGIAASLSRDWDLNAASLLVVGARDDVTESLDLCWELRSRLDREGTPLLVLVRPDQADLVTAVLEPGADNYLVLPVHHKDIASMLVRAHASNQPSRQTLNLEGAKVEDSWRDDGGQE